jgi:probable DNA repair protein
LTSYRECFEQAVVAAIAGATVLTGNQRSARAIQAAAEERLRGTRSSWLTPVVLPLEAFVARLYEQALITGEAVATPLQRAQEIQLWQQIIEHSPSGRELLLPESAAVLASQSFRIAMEYRIALDSAQMSASSESRAFAGWAAEFRSQLEARRWTCSALLKLELGAVHHHAGLPKEVFVFLAELTPAQRGFFDLLESSGVRVVHTPEWSAGVAATAHRHEFDGVEEELRVAAEWARHRLEESASARIGVIFFDLDRRRAQVQSAFRTVLHPEYLLGRRSACPFEIAAPLPLGEYAVVRCALSILEFVAYGLDFHALEPMLRSPFLGESAELTAKFLSRARMNVRRRVSVDELAGWLGDGRELPWLFDAVQRLPAAETLAAENGAGHWAELARQILAGFGWPRGVAHDVARGAHDVGLHVTLDSVEYQCTESWREVLASVASLELLGWRGDFRSFVAQLGRSAALTRFKPETLDAPVQVMDANEAEGSVFDALWIGSCTDQLWPAPLRLPALLPLALLKSAGYPLAGSAEAELHAARTTARLLHSAPAVSLSLARRGEDEGEQLWSPRFAHVPLAEANAWSRSLGELFPRTELEALSDSSAPPLDDGERVRGGTSLLEEQSSCPFRAFATRRLRSAKVEGPYEELEALDRGKLAERALQLIWEELKDSDGLKRAAREAVIARAVDAAMIELLPARDDAWSTRFRLIERERIIRLLREWLLVEERRPAFRVITHQKEVKMRLGGVPLSGRIDRIDEVAGARVVIDYKTGGGNSVGAWTVPRPLKPQLPLYVVAEQMHGANVSGAAFAEIRRGECGLKGYLRTSEILPCSDPTKRTFGGVGFDEYARLWASELERIALAFARGDAAVAPKIAPGLSHSPCEHCHLDQLCRVAEAADVDDAEADDE